MKSLTVKEIYASIQGESSFSGLPCTFIRLTGCSLRCRWCDTAYAFSGGTTMTLECILEKVAEHGANLVEVTGGEPLDQDNTPHLLDALITKGYEVLLETSGSINLNRVPKKVHIIMDLKCPGSQMSDQNRLENLDLLKPTDEIKFVISDFNDFEWAHSKIKNYDLSNRFKLLFSPAFGLCDSKDLVKWILDSKLPIRLNLQIHKYIWSPRAKGV